MQRKINLLLLLLAIAGGAVGFGIGEWLLNRYEGEMSSILLIGIYFGVLAFCIGLGCLIAEMVSPKLNGRSWRERYAGLSWKMLVPVTLAAFLALGSLFEFVYELDLGGVKRINDIVLVIDNSGSMTGDAEHEGNDPENERFTAAKELIGRMDAEKRVAVFTFDEVPQLIQPLTSTATNGDKQQIYAKIDAIEPTTYGTKIDQALTATMDHIRDQGSPDSGAMVILLSDGVTDVDMNAVLEEYRDRRVPINAIGLGNRDNPQLNEQDRQELIKGFERLQSISDRTGGTYTDVKNADQISLAFQDIYRNLDDHTLLTERTGAPAGSTYLQILHIVLILLIGAALGAALGVMFDNRFLAKSFGIGGAVAGLAAGLILEFGLQGDTLSGSTTRLLADLALAAVIALFTLIVPVREPQRKERGRKGATTNPSAGLGGRAGDRSSGF
ncbi:VWA domain-containing protein [Saccharibacillus alkalitolerans]|uniref:VWA domain-containing protein n=1 Tax=Saccharibacillus alkalitolerans TaxID=2705290 RepID=A0ABX0FDR5_9BACL|nr:vWA domain-containing protein [Saccharibacillus alkalitolerans]NGZ78033.1 VWA domain-containing protein [Saccharibacillus alkalitolerans]